MKIKYTCPYCGISTYDLEDVCSYCGAKNSSFDKKIIVENKEISAEEKQKIYIYKKQYNYALVSLVCGVLSIITIFGPGLILGVISIIFGYLSWPNKQVREKSIIGMAISSITIIILTIFFFIFLIGIFV